MSRRRNMEEEEDEIETAFAAGAMPPEWRPRLRASGLDYGDVNIIAAAIAKTHPILRSTWSRRDVAFKAFCFLAGLLVCLIAILSRETEGFMVSLLILGLVGVVVTPIIAVLDEREPKKIRAAVRTVLKNFLLSPV